MTQYAMLAEHEGWCLLHTDTRKEEVYRPLPEALAQLSEVGWVVRAELEGGCVLVRSSEAVVAARLALARGLLDDYGQLTTSEYLELLEERGYEVSEKTAARDLAKVGRLVGWAADAHYVP